MAPERVNTGSEEEGQNIDILKLLAGITKDVDEDRAKKITHGNSGNIISVASLPVAGVSLSYNGKGKNPGTQTYIANKFESNVQHTMPARSPAPNAETIAKSMKFMESIRSFPSGVDGARNRNERVDGILAFGNVLNGVSQSENHTNPLYNNLYAQFCAAQHMAVADYHKGHLDYFNAFGPKEWAQIAQRNYDIAMNDAAINMQIAGRWEEYGKQKSQGQGQGQERGAREGPPKIGTSGAGTGKDGLNGQSAGIQSAGASGQGANPSFIAVDEALEKVRRVLNLEGSIPAQEFSTDTPQQKKVVGGLEALDVETDETDVANIPEAPPIENYLKILNAGTKASKSAGQNNDQSKNHDKHPKVPKGFDEELKNAVNAREAKKDAVANAAALACNAVGEKTNDAAKAANDSAGQKDAAKEKVTKMRNSFSEGNSREADGDQKPEQQNEHGHKRSASVGGDVEKKEGAVPEGRDQVIKFKRKSSRVIL